jgi:hypothetical protein
LDGDGFTIMFVTGRVPGSLILYFGDAAICKGGVLGGDVLNARLGLSACVSAGVADGFSRFRHWI